MRFLQYRDLDLRRVRKAFDKVRASIEADDFRSADVKKLHAGDFYRARLAGADRLLLRFVEVGGETVCLALEVLEHHAYDRSRFLRGAPVDEARIEAETAAPPVAVVGTDGLMPRWLHPTRLQFELFDKPIVLDDAQDEIRRHPAPLLIAGSAGSGKTAVTLSRLRDVAGRVLYVTLSPYLAQTARSLYDAHGYENTDQQVDFLSYREFVESLRVPPGREVAFRDFRGWFERHRAGARAIGDVDAHGVFEEFRGVLGAQPSGPMSREEYLALGTRQSLLGPSAREAAHALFGRYRQWLGAEGLYDLNLVAHEWKPLAEPVYDFVVIDEMQDLTPVQLALVLGCLARPGQFLLCGDSNQIVHPNFFSWASVRSMFWQGAAGDAAGEAGHGRTLHVLRANYRNTRSVTELANRLLKVKHARFGSVDRESGFLVESAAPAAGAASLVAASDANVAGLDAASRASVHHAVLVLSDEDKAAARARFRTPLLFSVHEAKGLEYPNVVLFNFVSGRSDAYAEICDGVRPADLEREDLEFRRAKDKSDKSLEIYKFYVNALYVGMTRAAETLTLVESDASHPLLGLLGVKSTDAVAAPAAKSTKEEWAQEARKLELQGKQEQASAIRDAFLRHRPVPWTPWNRAVVEELALRALDPRQPGAKPRQALRDYALWHGQHRWIERLARAGFEPAEAITRLGEVLRPGVRIYGLEDRHERAQRALAAQRQRQLQPYAARNFKDLLRDCDQYGIDHRTPVGATPLMLAARAGNAALISALLERGASPEIDDEFGHTAWHHAVSRAMEDPGFARASLAAVFDLLAPAAIDVQTGGRLVRLERHQGEYWVLTLMMSGLKTLWSRFVERRQEGAMHGRGWSAEQLHEVLDGLPPHLWKDKRRKRAYVGQVLARAEVNSAYRPARRLWARASHGHYVPNPGMLLRRGDGWVPVYEALHLSWIDEGTGGGGAARVSPAKLVARVVEELDDLVAPSQ